ncbi:hypothetical protein PsYK624_081560 [Phanerochaete sordida]|uniref:Uncharacterized protein n=1 Tax=Phanerochaete sordida TaxID=48140 RepID=A0A9P3GBU0_9APHY|nr:hypothetical protein PsYK624_081560 [Phanerochaete sordida]
MPFHIGFLALLENWDRWKRFGTASYVGCVASAAVGIFARHPALLMASALTANASVFAMFVHTCAMGGLDTAASMQHRQPLEQCLETVTGDPREVAQLA